MSTHDNGFDLAAARRGEVTFEYLCHLRNLEIVRLRDELARREREHEHIETPESHTSTSALTDSSQVVRNPKLGPYDHPGYTQLLG